MNNNSKQNFRVGDLVQYRVSREAAFQKLSGLYGVIVPGKVYPPMMAVVVRLSNGNTIRTFKANLNLIARAKHSNE